VCYTTTKKSIVRAALFFALFSSLFPLSIECLKSRHPTFYVILLARAPHACARVRCAYLVTNGAAPVNASSATPLTHCNLLTARIDPRADAMSGWEQQQQQQQHGGTPTRQYHEQQRSPYRGGGGGGGGAGLSPRGGGGGGLSPLQGLSLLPGPEISAMAVADAIFEEIRASGTETRAPEREISLLHPHSISPPSPHRDERQRERDAHTHTTLPSENHKTPIPLAQGAHNPLSPPPPASSSSKKPKNQKHNQ
jgi:hypothetical protein